MKQAVTVVNCEMITILLSAGYSHVCWASNQQPLHLAAMNGHAAAVKVLMDAGGGGPPQKNCVQSRSYVPSIY